VKEAETIEAALPPRGALGFGAVFAAEALVGAVAPARARARFAGGAAVEEAAAAAAVVVRVRFVASGSASVSASASALRLGGIGAGVLVVSERRVVRREGDVIRTRLPGWDWWLHRGHCGFTDLSLDCEVFVLLLIKFYYRDLCTQC
jgi:hypothetical protein